MQTQRSAFGAGKYGIRLMVYQCQNVPSLQGVRKRASADHLHKRSNPRLMSEHRSISRQFAPADALHRRKTVLHVHYATTSLIAAKDCGRRTAISQVSMPHQHVALAVGTGFVGFTSRSKADQ